MSRNIVPRIDKGANLGTPEKNWDKLHVDAVVLRGNDLQALLNGKTNLNTLMAKGDIYVATGPGAVARLAKGTDGYVLKANSGTTEGLMWGPMGARQELTGDMIVTVGSTGDFPTINAALENVVALYYPKYIHGDNCPRVTIRLLPGFVMEENVVVESLDLSWITITGVDEETTIIRGAIPTAGWVSGIGRSAFMVHNGGFLPIINQLFYMTDDSGDPATNGILAYKNSRAIINSGCGVRNAGYNGLTAYYNSIILANNTNFQSSGHYGIFAAYDSIVNAENADASSAGYHGIYAFGGSIINAANANASNVVGGSRCGVFAFNGSIINASNVNATNAGYASIRASGGSIVNAVNAQTSGSDYDIRAEAGGIINANGATVSSESKISPAPNTLTSSGIIFR